MKDYLSLKEQNSSTKKGIENQAQKTDEIVESEVEITTDEINEDEYKQALAEIDNLSIEDEFASFQKAPLKEFWDE